MNVNVEQTRGARKLDFDWRLLSYVKPYRLQIALAAVLFLVSTGLFLFFPLVSGQLVNAVTGTPGSLSPAQLIGVLIGLFVLRAIADIFSQYLVNYAGESMTFRLRNDVYRHLQSQGLSFFAARRTGELISRLFPAIFRWYA